MIPVSTLYDEYIARQKLSEQKKSICVYSCSPSRGVGTIKQLKTFLKTKAGTKSF